MAQKQNTLKVKVLDTLFKPISNASLIVFSKKDSSVLNTNFTDDKGNAIIYFDNEAGFLSAEMEFYFPQYFTLPLTIKLDTIILKQNSDANNVTIVSKIPITIKEDTIQFNETMFKKDSLKTIEDVFKKLPGVILLKDGSVEINGVKVTEILLEGKPLPMSDLKAIMQGLNGNLIDKIQFIDRKTDESRITGIDNGIREKVINLALKKKNKKIYSQDVNVGFGNKNRLEARNNITSSFKNNFLSSNINFNNTGRSNFSSINYYNPYGVSTGFSGSVSYRFLPNKKTTVNNNLSISKNETTYDELKNRVIFLKDSFNYYQQKLQQENFSKAIGLSGNLNTKPDSLSDFRFQYGISYNLTEGFRNEQVATQNNSKFTTNEGSRNNTNNNKRLNVNFTLNGGRSSKNKMYSWYLNTQYNSGQYADTAYQKNQLYFYSLLTSNIRKDTTRQQILNKTKNSNLRVNITNTFTIIKNLKLSVNLGVNNVENPNTRNALIYNYVTGNYEIANITLNNNVSNKVITITQSVGLQYTKNKHNFNANFVNNSLQNKNSDNIKDTSFTLISKFFTPSFSYNFNNKFKSINFSSNIRQRNPTSRELQPLVDNTNPLFIRKGNPNLKNEVSYGNNFSYNLKPNKNQWSINANASLNFTKNKIANNTTFDTLEGKQSSIYINLPSNYYLTINTNINKYLKKYKLNYYAGLNVGISRDNNFLNNELNKLNNFNIRPKAGLKLDKTYYYFEINLGYLFQTNTYSLRPSQNINIGNITNEVTLNLMPTKNIVIVLDYDQLVNNNKRSIQKVNNVNGSVAYNFGAKKTKSIKISGFDLLNQNSNVQQNINDYYEETVTTNAVRRYFMLSFSYKFNKASLK